MKINITITYRLNVKEENGFIGATK